VRLLLSFDRRGRPKNILYRSTDPDIGMHVPCPSPSPVLILHRPKHLHSPDEQLTSLAGSFVYVAPEVLKNIGHGKPVDIWSTGIITPTRIHKPIALSLSVAIITYVLFWSYPPFVQTTSHVDTKIEFQSPYWNLVSDHAKSFIRRLVALDPLHRPSADEALRGPWLANTPSHVDLSPTLKQNWSPYNSFFSKSSHACKLLFSKNRLLLFRLS